MLREGDPGWTCRPHPALHPWLDLYQQARACTGAGRLDMLNRWARQQDLRNGFGKTIRFVHATGALHAAEYEWRIGGQAGGAAGDMHADMHGDTPGDQRGQDEGLVDTRCEGSGGDHDLLNALAWLCFPLTKACLNRCHVDEIRQSPPAERRRLRSRARDHLTLFDENGAMLLTEDESLIEWLATRQWQRLFLDQRERLLAHARLHVFGHGLLQKCLNPFPSMTARIGVLRIPPSSTTAQMDRALSEKLAADWPALPTLAMPVCGWPGWDAALAGAAVQDAAFYGNREIFRV